MTPNPEPKPQIPDPNGPPVIAYAADSAFKSSASFGVKLFAGSTATLLIVACMSQSTSGAMRSTRLQWQQQQTDRQTQIAEIQSQCDSPESLTPSTPTEQPHD